MRKRLYKVLSLFGQTGTAEDVVNLMCVMFVFMQCTV